MFDSVTRASMALEYFLDGYNCSQSVAMAYSDVIGLNKEKVAALTSGFGGGVARLREVCGCVSGMALVAGAAQPACNPSDKAERTRNYALVQKLAGDFRRIQGSIVCRELLGIRAASKPESPEPSDRTAQYYHSRGCADYVACAAAILASNLNNLSAREITESFAARGVEYRSIDCVNWPEEYPYRPSVLFAALSDKENLYLHFKVREDVTAAAAETDRGRVWEDSCVEFFVAFDDTGYYNLECNCIGRLVLSFGPDREERSSAPDEVFANIGRWSSAGSEPFQEKHFDEWEVALAVPLKSFFRHNLSQEDLKRLRFNVYKCGDKLSKPHFLSMFPIAAPAPDFHRPEFFSSCPIDTAANER